MIPAMNPLRELRERAKLSQAALAEKAGTSQPQIRRLESSQRKLTKEWAERLAPHLHVRPQDLLFSDHEGMIRDVIGLPVLGKSRAGDWLDISIMDDWHEPEVIHVARDPRYPHAKQYALKVEGDSMSEIFPDGCFVTVVNFADTGLGYRPKMVVHVEQRMGGTSLVETTIKQISDDMRWLMPRSSNPVHKPLPIEGNAATEIEVKGIVTGKWEPVDFD